MVNLLPISVKKTSDTTFEITTVIDKIFLTNIKNTQMRNKSEKKQEPARYEGQSEENEFDNIDGGDLSNNGEEDLSGAAETKEGDSIATPGKTRERRKAPSTAEAAKIIRLMPYEDRAAVIAQVREDMRLDIAKEQESEEKAADEKKQRLERLANLKSSL